MGEPAAPLDLPPELRERQARGSDPHASAWVSANAGSGKTYLLAQRVIRLLLTGADPGRVLCLTFTKAAAAEMASRVFEILGGWATWPDDELAEEIIRIEGRRPDPAQVSAARRLFARALETPGGLKIQTIHSFCERLLHQFPFEANVAGHFEVMDADIASALLEQARAEVLRGAADQPDQALGPAYQYLISTASDGAIADGLADFISKRTKVREWFGASGGLDGAIEDLARRFGLTPEDSLDGIHAEMAFPGTFDRSAAENLIPILTTGSKTDQSLAERFSTALAAREPDQRANEYLAIFFRLEKGRMVPRALNRIVTKAIKDEVPDLIDQIGAEMVRLQVCLDKLQAIRSVEATAAIMRIAEAVLAQYERLKAARGLLDFDDLVTRTGDLLSRSDAAQWVHYKLDFGLDHILVDEAQDTSPQQWRVIASLAEEFFSGAGARLAERTLFSVGDEKQSIYSFQGAVPRWFADMRRTFGRRAGEAQKTWHNVSLPLSFRSTPEVLAAVDTVFADPVIARGVSGDGVEPHEAIRRNQHGLVEIWPLEEPEEIPEPDDWTAPLDRLENNSPPVRLAEKIARHISDVIAQQALSADGEKTISAGDILVLVRKRTQFVNALTRALKDKDLPVAGADRIALLDHIAVLDLMAVADFALLPEDDLTLAAVLKSPLIELSEEDLFTLAHGRKGGLWPALRAARTSGGPYASAYERLTEIRRRADFMPPFEFFSRILGPDGGRRAFHRHFGVEADDVLDEFLDRALAFENTGQMPSLQAFLAWLRSGTAEIKREVDPDRDEIRIMTVHGAKGLEAGIVFVVDTGSVPVHASHRPNALPLNGSPRDPEAMVWARAQTATPAQDEAMQQAIDLADDEYRRLLYVAMTRAKDQLYLCGYRSKRPLPEDCWYALVARTLMPQAREITNAEGDVAAWRLGADLEFAAADASPVDEVTTPALPDWLAMPVPKTEGTQRLQPSRAAAASSLAPTSFATPVPTTPTLDGRDYGTLVHMLLQVLPDKPASERPALAEALLKQSAIDLDAPVRQQISAEAIAVLEDPLLAWIFAKGTRAEVAIQGEMTVSGGQRQISGQIDRLVIDDDTVTVIDFKTDRSLPQTAADVAIGYTTQLALYRHLLAAAFSGKLVRAALLWTRTGRLMEIGPDLLDAAVAKFTASSADPS